jgi:hypothetical protein
MGRLFKAKIRRKIWRNWGYISVPVILWCWIFTSIGLAPLAVASALTTGFFLFQARVPCGAKTRQRDRETGEFLLCRNDAKGLLGGCGQYQAHKWGNAKLIISRSSWGQFARSLLRKVSGQAAAVSALASSCSVLVAVGALVVNAAK